MAYDYIKRGKAEENGYTNTKVFKMFGISSTGYYNYVARKEDRNGKLAAKRKDESYVISRFKEIIKVLGFVPGKRTFRRHMFRRFNYTHRRRKSGRRHPTRKRPSPPCPHARRKPPKPGRHTDGN